MGKVLAAIHCTEGHQRLYSPLLLTCIDPAMWQGASIDVMILPTMRILTEALDIEFETRMTLV